MGTPPPNTNTPAALVNFIFRQLPDDVVDEIIQEAGGSGKSHGSVIAVVGGVAVAAGQDTVTIGLVQNLAEEYPSHCRTASARAAIR